MNLSDRDQTILQALVVIVDAGASGDAATARAVAMTAIDRLFLENTEPSGTTQVIFMEGDPA